MTPGAEGYVRREVFGGTEAFCNERRGGEKKKSMKIG